MYFTNILSSAISDVIPIIKEAFSFAICIGVVILAVFFIFGLIYNVFVILKDNILKFLNLLKRR